MKTYENEIKLYFELKGTPFSSQESYFRRINSFIKFIINKKKSADEILDSDIQQYILYLKNEKGLSAGTINNYISGIKFFYTHILGKQWNSRKVPRMRRIHKMPVVPSKEDILALINGTDNLKHKAILFLMYGSGLRVSEVAKLKISDICSKTMRIRVDDAKHNTNRYTILSKTGLEVLRKYFKKHFKDRYYTPDDWLFPGQNPGQHIHTKTIKNTVIKIRNKLGMDKNISSHTLRHGFATYALENGVELVYIQQLLGHKNLKTTEKYIYMTSKSLMGIKSPLDMQRGDIK